MPAGTVYRVVTVPKEPFIYFDEKKRHYVGYLIDILNKIAGRLNFTYVIYEEKESQFGYQSSEGQWNGMVGELIAARADIGLSGISLTSERMRVVDFTDPIYPSTGISILMQKPEVHTVFFRFFTLLSIKVWLCITASYLFTSGVLWILDMYSPFSYRNRLKNRQKIKEYLDNASISTIDHENVDNDEDTDEDDSDDDYESANSEDDDEEEGRKIFNVKESLWFCFTSLTPQGGGKAPRNYSGRLIATTWWLFGFIIIASYTANLAAFLTIARFDRTIDTFQDLLAHYRYSYTAVRNSEASRYFERRRDIEMKFYNAWKALTLNDDLSPYEKAQMAVWEYPLNDRYSRINSALTLRHTIRNLKEGLGMFREKHSKFALIAETTDVQFQVMINCSFKEIGPEFSKKPYAIALRKDSPLTEPFNVVIRDLIKSRWMRSARDKWWTNNPKRKYCYNMDEKNEGLLIENVGGVFTIFVIGIGISLTVMLGEFIYLKRQHQKNQAFNRSFKEKTSDEHKDDDNDNNQDAQVDVKS